MVHISVADFLFVAFRDCVGLIALDFEFCWLFVVVFGVSELYCWFVMVITVCSGVFWFAIACVIVTFLCSLRFVY